MLEASLHKDNAFLTLTYSDQTLPLTCENLPSLDPKDLSDWFKRFRRAIAPLKIRYFAVGEYGGETQRPHYHAIIFGYPSCRYGRSRYSHRENCCYYCDLVRDTWSKGQVDLGTVETASAQYVCGYITKKLTAYGDPKLHGRYPEFARMSRQNGGLGLAVMHEVASTLLQFDLEKEPDVPSSLRHGSRELPLGNYLTRKLRTLVGKDEKAPQSTIDKIQEELHPMRETAFNNSRSFKQEVINETEQQALNQETKWKIRKAKRTL